MKAAPLCKQFKARGIPYEIIHSGQHYDFNMRDVFWNELGINDVKHLDINLGNVVKNMQQIIAQTKKLLAKHYGEIEQVIVFGDVATSCAVALATNIIGLPLVHVEAGLRSFDIAMPEELNRITIDHLSSTLLAPSEDAVRNLTTEGIYNDVHMVGNIMIDSLVNSLKRIPEGSPFKDPYVLVTFHRPENVDNQKQLTKICKQLNELAHTINVVFSIHPRTKYNIEEFGLEGSLCNVHQINPVGYFAFMRMAMHAKAVITDSGGIQEETTYLNVPCFTVRKNTERPITIHHGTNILTKADEIVSSYKNMRERTAIIPPLWDGYTASRIVDILEKGKQNEDTGNRFRRHLGDTSGQGTESAG
jgi:UDP-N-acetylglucosamine 2-epimerase (non-hydrolysing)